MKSFKFFVILGFTALLSIGMIGCDDDNPAEVGDPGPLVIMPLSIGNQWVIEERRSHEFFPDVDTTMYVYVVDSTFHWGDEEWYSITTTVDSNSYVSFRRNDYEGLYNLEIYDWENDTTMGLFLKYPGEPGDIWETPWQWDDNDGFNDSLRLMSISETVTVPAGTFDGCYLYRYNDNFYNEGLWYKPGIGFIKSTWHFDRVMRVYELVSYSVE